MNPQQGLICSLTGEKATFESECADFKKDETVTPTKSSDGKPTNGFATAGVVFLLIGIVLTAIGGANFNSVGAMYGDSSVKNAMENWAWLLIIGLILCGIGVLSFIIAIIKKLTKSKK